MIFTKKNNQSKSLLSIIITAAGSSTRMNMGTKKEFLPLKSGTVLSENVKTFLQSTACSLLVITTAKDNKEQTLNALYKDNQLKQQLSSINLQIIEGGATRQESVYKALLHINKVLPQTNIVLIHDGARPFVSEKIITDTIEAVKKYKAAAPGIMPVDTQKVFNKNNFITTHLKRNQMCAIQTPQGFIFNKLLKAHKKASLQKKEYTDDTEIWGKYVGKVKIVNGDEKNKKITYSSDYTDLNQNANKGTKMIRTGLGYDIHQLVKERNLIIGGVTIPHTKGEKGHSDGDALLHAITDALLGASGLGDIGSFFPPEDNQYKDANSIELLKTVWKIIKQNGWKLENLDCVIKLEKPKFLPYRNDVITSIANALEVNTDQVFVKAKTGEKLDSVGEEKAIEAWCSCLLSKE